MRDNETRRSRAVGTLIREHREFAGYSRFRLAELLGIPERELERWELAGVPLPPSEGVLKVAQFLDIERTVLEGVLAREEHGRKARRLESRISNEHYGVVPELDYAIDV